MQLVAGIDEAGYGPLLGPLVVGTTMLQLPDAADPEGGDLWQRLADCVLQPSDRRRRRRGEPPDRRVVVGDSKQVYSPRRGVAELERSVLALAGWRTGQPLNDEQAFWSSVAPGMQAHDPWEQPRHGTFPLAGRLSLPVPGLRPQAPDVLPVRFEASVVSAARFNDLWQRHRNKAAVAWTAVGAFLHRAWEYAEQMPVSVVVDRQGGRSRYGGLLQDLFRDAFVWAGDETHALSWYRIQGGGRRMRVSFRVHADEHSWPVAAASMLAKYCRELLMGRLNGYFSQHDPGLRRTAGYYVDAQRFLADTVALRANLGVTDARFVRVA